MFFFFKLTGNGHTCPAGTDFNILIYELHRQADQFVEPYKFLPERFLKEPTWHPFSYLPFSAGPRNCIGKVFFLKTGSSTLLLFLEIE